MSAAVAELLHAAHGRIAPELAGKTNREALRIAFNEVGHNVPAARVWLAARGYKVARQDGYKLLKELRAGDNEPASASTPRRVVRTALDELAAAVTATLGVEVDPARPRLSMDWQDQGLCAQTDPESFYPEKGGSTRDAKKVCAACPVKAECLEYALAADERFGVWGGRSERERRALKKQREGGQS